MHAHTHTYTQIHTCAHTHTPGAGAAAAAVIGDSGGKMTLIGAVQAGGCPLALR